MKTKLLLAAGVMTLLAMPIAASADEPTSPSRTCLRVGEIDNFNAPDNRTVIITDNFHKKFRVDLMAPCTGLTFKNTLGVDSPGSSRLTCVSGGDSIVTRDIGGGSLRCPIRSVVAYTPEMEKADKDAREQAKLDRRMTE